eukprot:g2757.t1
MYVLKQMERQRGIGFLRLCCTSDPLQEARWLKEWRQSGEVGLVRFLAGQRLATVNPFRELPLWAPLQEAVGQAMTPSGNLHALEMALEAAHREQPRAAKAMLLAAVYHHCFLLRLVPGLPPATRTRLRAVHDFLGQLPTHPDAQDTADSAEPFAFAPSERAILLFLAQPPPAGPEPAGSAVAAGGSSWLLARGRQEKEDETAPVRKFLALHPRSSSEDQALVRVMVHLLVVSWLSPLNQAMGWFRLAARGHEGLQRLRNSYFPGQPEDAQAMAVRVMGGRWYQCPNGHAYYVDNCGRPMQILQCATCGVDIGGENHNLLGTNKDLKNKAPDQQTELNYCLRTPEEEKDPLLTVRSLSPTSTRTIRLLLHAALTLGALSAPDSGAWDQTARHTILNAAYFPPGGAISASSHFLAHLRADWRILRAELVRRAGEDTALCLHSLLNQVSANECGQQQQPAAASAKQQPADAAQLTAAMFANANRAAMLRGAARVHARRQMALALAAAAAGGPAGGQGLVPPAAVAALEAGGLTADSRYIWENTLAKVVESTVGATALDQVLAQARRALGVSGASQDPGQLLVAELTDEGHHDDEDDQQQLHEPDDGELKHAAAAPREESSAALWRYRASFSLEDFQVRLNLHNARAEAQHKTTQAQAEAAEAEGEGGSWREQYPVLAYFLQHERALRGVRDLPAVLAWQQLLLHRFNRALTDLQAKAMTVREVLDGLGGGLGERQKWAQAFGAFARAWNQSWPLVKRFECIEIPHQYAGVAMDETQPIGFCLPTNKDEGICVIALSRYLAEQHNRFVELVDETLLLRGQHLQRGAVDEKEKQREVSTKFLSPEHVLSYELEGAHGLTAFLEKQCVAYSSSGHGQYDFARAEQFLLDVWCSEKPLIQLELRLFSFANERGVLNTQLLQAKVKQEAPGQELERKIKSELSEPGLARRAMELVETCIHFIQGTGGAALGALEIGEMALGEYARDVLLLGDAKDTVAGFGHSPTLANQLQLKHLAGVWRCLREYTEELQQGAQEKTDSKHDKAGRYEPAFLAPVRGKYRVKLSQADRSALQAAVEGDGTLRLDVPVLLAVMREAAETWLSEDTLGANRALHETLAFMQVPLLSAGERLRSGAQDGEQDDEEEQLLGDLAWFALLPKTLLNQHFVEVYLFLAETRAGR